MKHTFRATAIALCAVIAVSAVIPFSSATLWGGSFTSAVETIHKKELQNHCSALASDAMEGRETGSRGGQAAGAYIVDLLRKKKLRPAGVDGDFYQPFLPNSRNILAVLPGSDPALRNEYVLVGAHYDHVGYGNSRNSRGPVGYIHNGADDNASGVATLLELVDAFSSLDVAPNRSILFAFWDGEEKGLLGSQYWVSAPTVPLAQIRLAFNIDMVGRLRQNRAEVFGSRSAPGLRQLLSSQNGDPYVLLNFPWETRGDSDHYIFFVRRIPYLMIFTGKHEDYHTPYDDVDKLNVEGIERVARLLFRAVYSAAQATALPAFRPAALQEGAPAQHEAETPLPLPPSRLGVTWDEVRAKQHAIQIVAIDPGSPADSAGLQVGDRFLEFDGLRIATGDDLRIAVYSSGDKATTLVERPGEKSPLTRNVLLRPNRKGIGISCRFDETEPRCAIVNQVLSGSPAYRAGLKVNDRILKVAGSTFASAPELERILARPARVLPLEIERDGHPQVLEVPLQPPHTASPVSPH